MKLRCCLDFVESCRRTSDRTSTEYIIGKRGTVILLFLHCLLGTGIRVSECVGLDLKDVDFKNNGITVTQKRW